jgi:hypothetical protein
MEQALFKGSRLKIKRADKHIRELHGELNSFGRTSGYGTRSETDSETGEGTVGFEMTENVSDNLSVIVGDVVHNLRAALDLAMYAMVKLFSSTPPNKYTRFPLRIGRNSNLLTKYERRGSRGPRLRLPQK